MDGPSDPLRVALLEHEQYVRRLARSLVFGDASAEDVAQETFTRALTYPPQAPTNLRAWLAKITRNVAYRRGRRSGSTADLATEHTAPSAAEVVGHAETLARIAGAVQSLREPYRSVVFLRYYSDLSREEIATTLGRTPNTVKVQLVRALNMLRTSLDESDRTKAAPDSLPWRASVFALLGRRGPVMDESARPTASQHGRLRRVPSRAAFGAVLLVLLGLSWVGIRAMLSTEGAGDWGSSTGSSVASSVGLPAANSVVQLPNPQEPSPSDIQAAALHAVSGRLIAADSGQPVPGARVVAYAVIDGEASYAVSDTEGRFTTSVQVADDEAHQLWLQYGSWGEPLIVVITRPNGTLQHVFVDDYLGLEALWKLRASVDLGDIQTYVGAPLTVAVTSSDGTPIEHADVFLCTPRDGNAPLTRSIVLGTTDASGSISWSHRLAPRGDSAEPYYLLAVHESAGIGSVAIRPTPGDRSVDATIRLNRQSLTLNVTDTRGNAVPGARATVFPRLAPYAISYFACDQPGWWHDSDRVSEEWSVLGDTLSKVTDSNGQAVFASLPLPAGDGTDGSAPQVDVCVHSASVHGDLCEVQFDSQNALVTVKAADKDLITVSLACHVVSERGTPVPDASVSWEGAEATTDSAGNAVIASRCLHAESRSFCVAKDGYAAFLSSLSDIDALSGPLNVTLFEYRPTAGVLVDERGVPMSGVILTAACLPQDGQVGASWVNDSCATDDSGHFQFYKTIARTLSVDLRPGLSSGNGELFGGSSSLEIEGGRLDIRLVADSAHWPRDLIIECTNPDGSRVSVVDAVLMSRLRFPALLAGRSRRGRRRSDRFTLAAPPPGEDVRVWALLDNGQIAYCDVRIEPGREPVTVEVPAQPPLRGEISGRVVGCELGQAGASISLRPVRPALPAEWDTPATQDWFERQAAVDLDGGFSFSDVFPGQYMISLSDTQAKATMMLTLSEGETLRPELKAEACGFVTFVNGAGTAERIHVYAKSSSALPHVWIIEGEPGSECRLAVPPGCFSWEAKTPLGGNVGSGSLCVGVGDSVRLDCAGTATR